jgi:hypothetical protein
LDRAESKEIDQHILRLGRGGDDWNSGVVDHGLLEIVPTPPRVGW